MEEIASIAKELAASKEWAGAESEMRVRWLHRSGNDYVRAGEWLRAMRRAQPPLLLNGQPTDWRVGRVDDWAAMLKVQAAKVRVIALSGE